MDLHSGSVSSLKRSHKRKHKRKHKHIKNMKKPPPTFTKIRNALSSIILNPDETIFNDTQKLTECIQFSSNRSGLYSAMVLFSLEKNKLK